MAKAKNCSSKCNSYEYCVKEGNTGRFMSGAECSDFSPKQAKKKTVKKNVNVNPPDNKVVDYSYLLAQLKEDRDAVCRLANQLQSDIGKVNQRIDRIVEAHEKCKSLKGL